MLQNFELVVTNRIYLEFDLQHSAEFSVSTRNIFSHNLMLHSFVNLRYNYVCKDQLRNSLLILSVIYML